MKQLGLDLTQYGFGLTFSPEVAPPNTAGTFPPVTPPPFNLNTITGGFSANDFYVTVPTAMVRLLESDNQTRTLAKPSVRGAEGAADHDEPGRPDPGAQLDDTVRHDRARHDSARDELHLQAHRRQPHRDAARHLR